MLKDNFTLLVDFEMVCSLCEKLFSCNTFIYFWLASSIAIIVFHGLLALRFNLATKLGDLYYYGKLKKTDGEGAEEVNKKWNVSFLCSIPKRWFTHFYAMGVIVHVSVFVMVVPHFLDLPVPKFSSNWSPHQVLTWFNWPCHSSGLPRSSAYPLLTVYLLECVQMLRRLYECVCVSHFSPGTMSVVHYFYGVFFYSSFGIGLLSSLGMERVYFSDEIPHHELMCIAIGVGLFAVASIFQHKSMITFADLRSGQKEKSVDAHHIPRGHLFQWVSCPHYLCEILIYVALCVVYGGHNPYLLSLTSFVMTTQVTSALLTHHWYRETFPSYPAHRRAIIPFLL